MLTDIPALAEELTPYDREHANIYLRVLDAEAAGASWQEVIEKVFDCDPAADPDELQSIHAAHLARAKWMRDGGYLQLLSSLWD